MSGIVGIYNLDGRPVERTDIQRMLDSIAHRGPDGSGIWTDGSVGLGHRMLWTTPESLHEKLPMTNRRGDLTITADARIDNRDELIPALNLNGRPCETITDSEIILAAYEKWGEMCPKKLLGDFSFAIFDKREQKVYCARDPIGIKPFFYYFDGKTFYWGSEPRAIYEDSKISKEPNLQLICLYLLNRFDEREETLYKNICRLPGSQYMVLENGKIRKGQYWDVNPDYAIRYKTDEEYAEHFLELFKEAVRVRLRSHGPVGAMLSGGLDSSSIVCTAQLLYQEEAVPNNGFETFSIVFDQLPCDERKYINEVVRMWGLKANYFVYETHLESADFEKVQNYPDVGYFPTLLSYSPLHKDAQRKGVRILFKGIGGDDLLAIGFDHLTDLLFQGNFRRLVSQLRHDTNLTSRSCFSLFLTYCIRPLIPSTVKAILKPLLNSFRKDKIPTLIDLGFAKKAGISLNRIDQNNGVKFPTFSQQRIYDTLRYGWNVNIALDTLERFEPYFEAESRFPFFDRCIVEFIFALPEEQRWRDEWSKVILRNAMKGILPELVRKRLDKPLFCSTIDLELKHRQVQKVKGLLQHSNLAQLGVVDSDLLQEMYQQYQGGEPPHSSSRFSLELVIWFELWLRSSFSSRGERHYGD